MGENSDKRVTETAAAGGQSAAATSNASPSVGSILSRFSTIIILLGMCILLAILAPTFVSINNFLNILTQIAYIAIIGIGETFVIITAGIDLSAGSLVALTGVVAASLGGGQVPLVVCILVAVAVGAAAGLINGTLSAYGGIPPFIATLGMQLAGRGLSLIYSDGRPITNVNDSFNFIAGGRLLDIPMPVYWIIIFIILAHILLKHTKFGKYTYAIGGNVTAAQVSGINVKKYLCLIYVLSGAMAGVAGIITASRVGAGEPTAGVNFELDAIAATCIGGTSFLGGIGTIPGMLIGALIMGVLNDGLVLLNVSAYMQQVVKGIIIVGAVLLDMMKYKRKV